MVAERLAGEHVGQMDFDERDRHPRQRIAQGHAGMRAGTRVDQDVVDPVAPGLLDAVDEFAFMIALEGGYLDTGRAPTLDQ